MIIAQIIGFFAIALWVYSVQNKNQSKILFFQFLANLMYGVEYFLLNAFPAVAMNLSSSLRCLLFYNKRKNNEEIPKSWLIFFLLLVLLLGIITFDNIISIIPITITIFYTLSSWMKDTKWCRIVFLVCAFIWIYYNYKVKAYISIVGNVMEIISGIISLIRFRKKEN